MQTNDLIRELEKINVRFSYVDEDNNLWNGFSIDCEGISLYEKHLNSLFVDYFNEIDDHIDKLLLNKSINEVKLFINNKLNRFEVIRNPFVKRDNEYYVYHIERLSNDIESSELVDWNENNRYYQLYEKKAIIRMRQRKARLQIEYDFLTYKIDKVQFKIGLNEWETHEDAEDDGYDEEFIEKHFCLLRMERIGREYIDKSLKYLNDKYNFYLPKKEIHTNGLPHFTRSLTESERKTLFDGLLKQNFLPQDTDFTHFCFVFGGTVPSEKPFEPLKWQRTIALLAYFVDNMFGDTDSKRLWEITSNCFMIGNNKPNRDSLKNTVSKIRTDFKNKPNGYETIDEIII